MAGQAEMRAPGWYWARRKSGDEIQMPPIILMFDGAEWWSGIDGGRVDVARFAEIDERPISRSPAAPAGEVECILPWECSECADHPKLTHHGEGKFRCPSCDRLYFQHGTPAWERNFNPKKAAPAGEVEAAVLRSSLPLDGLPIERENMLAERQRLLDRKFTGDITSEESLRLAFIRYGLDVWVEADAAAATRAAQERRAAVEMREAASALCDRVADRLNDYSQQYKAEGRDNDMYRANTAWHNVTDLAAAIRALPIPGEEQKA